MTNKSDFTYWMNTYSRPSWNYLGKFLLSIIVAFGVVSIVEVWNIPFLTITAIVLAAIIPVIILFKWTVLMVKEFVYIIHN